MSPFGIHEDERVALFIDGPNFYATAKQLNADIDYKKLRAHFEDSCRFLRAYYYTALADTEEFSPIKPLIDWLSFNGYSMVTKPLKEFEDGDGRRRFKGNMSIEMAVDMLRLAPKVDHIVLFSGDGDFRALVEAIQQQGVRVSILSTIHKIGGGAMVADELRRQADNFIDLKNVIQHVQRDPNERATRQTPTQTR